MFVFRSRQSRARFHLGQMTESASRVALLLLACSLLRSVPLSVTSSPHPHPVMRSPAHDPEELYPFPADDSSGCGQPLCPFPPVLVATMTAHPFFFFFLKKHCFFSLFWLLQAACRISGPQPGIKPAPSPLLEAQSSNLWTIREPPVVALSPQDTECVCVH